MLFLSERESIFEIIIENGQLSNLKKRKSKSKPPLTAKEDKEVITFINEYYKKIIDKWINFFVLKKVVKVTKISKKLK